MNCCVKNCLNRATTEPNRSLGITFHKLPKEPADKAAWVKALASAGCRITKNLVVCAEHFLPEDFDDTRPNQQRVKSGVVPTLLTHPDPEELKVCRVCLALDVKMYDLKDYKLSEMFQNVTGISDIDKNDSILKRVCWECTARLTAAAAFRDKALLSDALLQDLVLIKKSDIVTLKQDYSTLKSTLTTQTIFTPSDISIEDLISAKKETEKNVNAKAIEKNNTKLKVTEEVKVEFQEHEPWIDVPVKTEMESDPIAVNTFNIRFQDQTDDSSMMNDDKSEVQTTNNCEFSREDTDIDCIGNNEDDTSSIEDKEYKGKEVSVVVEEKNARLSTRILRLGLQKKKQASGVSAAKKPKLDPQKDNSEHSLSPKHKNKGQEYTKTSENTKKITFKSIRISKKSISSKSVVQSKPKFCYDAICNYDDVVQTKGQENTALLHYNNDELNCKICNYEGINSSDIQRHVSTHNNVSVKNKPHKCDFCQSSFSLKRGLKRHISKHTGEKPHKCDICQCSFSEKGHLKTHIRIHTGEKPYKCDICQKSYIKKSDLKRHVRIHTGEKPYKCDICQDSFSAKGSLKTHIRTHTGEKPYKCDFCQSSFSLKSGLKRHISKHTGEKPHKCDICQYSFNEKGHLKTHIRIHTGEKPYKCDICQKSYIKKSDLKRHVRIHTGEKPYKCDICQDSFSAKGSLKTHIRTHTGEKPYKCDICQSSFRVKCTLKTHIRTHTGEKPYKCDICQDSFRVKSTLKTHIRTHTGEKPYKCDICQIGFSLKGHLNRHFRIHTGEKPYKCDNCQSSFNEKGTLKKHIRIHWRKCHV